jgi:hypothetical protein
VNTIGSGFDLPNGVAVDGSGNVFVADYFHNAVKEIVAVNGVVSSSSTVNTIGSGFTLPIGVAVDGSGNVFVADYGNNAVKEIDRSDPPTLSFASTLVGSTSSDSPQSVLFQNSGNQQLTATSLTVGANFGHVPGSGTPEDCTVGTASFSLAPGASCNLSISFTPTASGPLSSAATFTDNALNLNPATQSISLQGTGLQQSQTITFGAIANQVVGTQLGLKATASSGLTVSFSSLTPSVCTVSGATATMAQVGTCTIQASQSGNATYTAATPVSQSFSVIQKTQTITFNTIPSPQVLGSPLTLSASASSGLPVSFASTTTTVCTVSGTTATLVTAGTCIIQASQSGNATYAAATPVSQSFSVTDFSLNVTPSAQTIPAGHAASYSVALASVNSFTGNVALSCSGGPPHSTCSVSPTSVALSGSSTANVSLTLNTPMNVNLGTFKLTITAKSGADVHAQTVSVTVK